jgi:hypothetical protein
MSLGVGSFRNSTKGTESNIRFDHSLILDQRAEKSHLQPRKPDPDIHR